LYNDHVYVFLFPTIPGNIEVWNRVKERHEISYKREIVNPFIFVHILSVVTILSDLKHKRNGEIVDNVEIVC
jgi:hypothetical protein